jgi:excisionase family DNA binding protein
VSEVTRFSTVPEVARVLRVSKMTAYRLVHDGTLPAIRVGRSFRIPTKAVWAYVNAQLAAGNGPVDSSTTSYAPKIGVEADA